MNENEIVDSSVTAIMNAPIDEVIGGTFMVRHHIETLGRSDQMFFDSDSEVFAPIGRTTIHVRWEFSVREVAEGGCELNRVRSYATEAFLTFLARQGIPFGQLRTQLRPAAIAHNQGEPPLFAASIWRAALKRWLTKAG